MKKLKKILKYLGYTVLSIVVFVLLYLTTAYCLSRITVDKEPIESDEVTIYIKTNGVHTDLVVPVRNEQMDWSKEIKFSNTKLKDTSMNFLGMGWGDKGFYLETPNWSDLKFSVAFNAAFALSTTAIHATFFKTMTENDSCIKLNLSRKQYARLVDYISESFQKDSAGHFIYINTDANYGNLDAFYEANGSYSMLHTCNSWANDGLKKCGQKACVWTAFDSGIFTNYRK